MPIDFDKARARLDELLKECSVCGRKDWTLAPICSTVPGLDIERKAVLLSGRMPALVSVQCGGCGQVLFFNALALGAVTPAPAPAARDGGGRP